MAKRTKGKMKEWRRPVYRYENGTPILVKQTPHTRRNEKKAALGLRGLKL